MWIATLLVKLVRNSMLCRSRISTNPNFSSFSSQFWDVTRGSMKMFSGILISCFWYRVESRALNCSREHRKLPIFLLGLFPGGQQLGSSVFGFLGTGRAKFPVNLFIKPKMVIGLSYKVFCWPSLVDIL